MLNEEDVLAGLWKRRGAADETRAALACLQHGMTQAGQDFLLEAMSKASMGSFPAASPGARMGLYCLCLISLQRRPWAAAPRPRPVRAWALGCRLSAPLGSV
jgi:hypothetical protein